MSNYRKHTLRNLYKMCLHWHYSGFWSEDISIQVEFSILLDIALETTSKREYYDIIDFVLLPSLDIVE